MRNVATLLLFALAAFQPAAARPVLRTEADYQRWANVVLQGELEYRLPDATRVDILTDDLAIEVDWAEKWAEAIGQSAHYARETGRRPAILLIVKNEHDERYLKRAIATARNTRVELAGGRYAIAVMVVRAWQIGGQ